MMSKKPVWLWVCLLLTIGLLTVACSGDSGPTTPRPTRILPTVDPLFTGVDLDRDATAKVGDATPTLPPVLPTRTPFPTPIPQPDLPPPIAIYDDQLGPGWTAKYSSAEYDLLHTGETFDGKNAIRFTPRIGERVLFFTLDKNARPVREDRVLGIRFQLFSGEEGLAIEEFGMTIIGSDGNSHWVKNDASVVNVRNPNPEWLPEDDPISNLYAQNFSETTLGFLGVSRDIPPNVWVEAFNQLDERIYDPLYRNIVGFYFKTETTVRHDLLIDNIELVVLGGETE